MNNFEYYNPVKVYFGSDSIEKVGAIAAEYGKKAVIVSYTDISFYGNLFDRIHDSLKAAGVEYLDYLEVMANPTIAQAKKGVDVCKEFGADLLIGVGGGSAMDCTKVIAAGVCYPEDDIRKMIAFSHADGSQVPPKEALPMIMIPTLPATGSEMNCTAVITDEETVSKSYVWAPDCMYAKAALVDPALSKTLPPYQTACAALDTIAHTVEGYFNGDPDVNLELQDRMQEGLVRAVLDTLPKVLENPDDVQARGVMQWASAIALNGWVLSGTYTWAPMHQFGHVLSARYKATHGATLAVMMIAFMKYFATHPGNAHYEQFAQRMFGKPLAEAALEYEAMVEKVGVQTRISQFGAKEEDIDMLADDVERVSFNADGVLGSVPPMTKEDVKAIYRLAL
ncbi:iron-containing alcohol dehydrogenase [Clostridiaceae bacterium NSJ-31]|uniref:Iron-containing alcohol dehydrogenase n=1 Tax=Ligaoa zhengdingensis TaxID=2763658 RepID=A0A926I0E0_9FIRM|nr:iron-containing alcohol dehydrogenase [Ligaoa zhengdingensis]MBC8546902.1 iron-containing alcohol dehydrogenase [Ligaoa zhengdingensis]